VSAARQRGKYVVRVHAADHEGLPEPRLATRLTGELHAAWVLQAMHAHGVQVQHLAVAQHLDIHVAVALGREEKRAVDERVLVVHGQLRATHPTAHLRDLPARQVGQHEAARLVVTVRALVFHLDVVRVLLASRKAVEHRVIRTAPEYVPSCRLVVVGKEIEAVAHFAFSTTRGEGRGTCGTGGTHRTRT